MENIGVYILDALIVIAGILFVKLDVAKYIKFFVKEKIVRVIVMAVEQKVTGSKMGEEKKKTVIQKLEELHIKVDDAVDDMIEAVVAEINILTKSKLPLQ